MKRLILFVLVLAPHLLFAACPDVTNSAGYVRKGATGTASGADWTNACTDFSGVCGVGSLSRGCTYYVATGTYTGGYTFTVATSGTTLITILGATVASHGTATGWSSSFSVSAADGGAQATFSNPNFAFTTNHWIFDGVVPTSLWDQTCADYGFKFAANNDWDIVLGAGVGNTYTDFKVSHGCFPSTASSVDAEKEFLTTGDSLQAGATSNVTISHSLFTGWQGLMFMKSNGIGATFTGWILEYNVALNAWSSSNHHGEMVDPDSAAANGTIVRYNLFLGHSSVSGTDGSTGTIVANNSSFTNGWVYGNVFDGQLVGNGIVTGTSTGAMSSTNIYNNDVVNYNPAINPNSAFCGTVQTSGVTVQNNLNYNGNGSVGNGCTNDWNAYFTTSNTPSETHGQTGSGNPFVNSASFNYNLTTDTTAGLAITNWSTLPAGCTVGVNCLNIDAAGVTRGANGTIDRGALQIAGSGSPTVSLSPSPVAFGNQQQGTSSSATTVTLTNTGTATLTLNTPYFTISGTNASDFSVTGGTCSNGGSVVQNGTCTILVVFSPTQPNGTNETATLNVNGNASGTDNLTGTSVVPTVTLLPSPAPFNNVLLGITNPPTIAITLTNTSVLTTTINSISLSGDTADFTQTNTCGATLGAGNNCVITVKFTPHNLGVFAGTLSVVDNAVGSPQSVALSATGVGNASGNGSISGSGVVKVGP